MAFSKNKKTMVLSISAALLLLVGVCAWYLGDYYPADEAAIQVLAPEAAPEMQEAENGNLLWVPENPTAGFLFYPGGKVDHRAYIPLMETLAAEDILCVLVEMPFRLAVLDMDAAEGIPEAFPQVERWYMGGHSLGGSMAASWVAGNPEDFAGLVLLGAYSTADLSGGDLQVLSLYGSEDRVMNMEKYQQYRPNLPADFTEIRIEGGCHAFFGAYGPQAGDGTPTISGDEQLRITAEAILAMVNAA